MNSILTLACLVLASWPQENPPKKEKANSAREAVLEAFSNPQPTSEEKTISAGSGARKTELPVKSSGGNVGNRARTAVGEVHGVGGGGGGGVSGSGSATGTSAKPVAPVAAPAPVAPPVATASDMDVRASILFTANALYQQELATRQAIISVAPITTPEAALAELEAGNSRFVKGSRVRTLMTAQEPEQRETLASGQSPFAVIVACSDSRAMDNLIFDQELGRIFTIRVAGNTPGTLGIASIEYAIEHLGAKAVVVMGHSRCGAVGAVADSKGKPLPGNMHAFQEHMAGLLDVIVRDPNETDAEYKDRLEKENARRQAEVVYDRSEIIREFVDQRKILVVPAVYDLHTGKVTFFKAVEPKRHEPDSYGYEHEDGDSHDHEQHKRSSDNASSDIDDSRNVTVRVVLRKEI